MSQQEVRLAEELGTRRKAPAGLAATFRDGSQLGAAFRKQRQDEVLLRKRRAVEHDGLARYVFLPGNAYSPAS
jgi:hypothetical protein